MRVGERCGRGVLSRIGLRTEAAGARHTRMSECSVVTLMHPAEKPTVEECFLFFSIRQGSVIDRSRHFAYAQGRKRWRQGGRKKKIDKAIYNNLRQPTFPVHLPAVSVENYKNRNHCIAVSITHVLCIVKSQQGRRTCSESGTSCMPSSSAK